MDSRAVIRASHRRNAVLLLVNILSSSIPHPRTRSHRKMLKKPGISRAYCANANLFAIDISSAGLVSDRSRRIRAIVETMRGLAPWDMCFAAETANETLLKWGMAAPLRTPGKELPPNEIHQFEETETLKVDDYDRLSEMAVSQFKSMVRRRLYPEITPEAGPALLQETLLDARSDREEIEAAGCEMAVGGFLQLPLEWLSLGRSMQELIFDLHDRPEEVNRLSDREDRTWMNI